METRDDLRMLTLRFHEPGKEVIVFVSLDLFVAPTNTVLNYLEGKVNEGIGSLNEHEKQRVLQQQQLVNPRHHTNGVDVGKLEIKHLSMLSTSLPALRNPKSLLKVAWRMRSKEKKDIH